jgi:hypothetical protein
VTCDWLVAWVLSQPEFFSSGNDGTGFWVQSFDFGCKYDTMP